MSRPLTVLVGLVALVATAPVYAQDGSFVRDGVTLHYRTAGSGPPIVFLSGGPGFDVDYMIPLGDFVPATYQRLFYEQRGTGRSLVTLSPETMTLRHVVDDLEALRVHLKQERLFLLGHSWGGILAMSYAAAYPDRVDRMILIGSGGPTFDFGPRMSDNIEVRLRPEDREAARYWSEAAKRGVDADKAALEQIRAIMPGYFFDRARALAFAAQTPDGSLHTRVNALLFADLATHYDVRQGLATLARPVLIVQGHQDPMSDKTAEAVHAAIAGSVLTYINKCGHFPWIEQPDPFRAALAAFFK